MFKVQDSIEIDLEVAQSVIQAGFRQTQIGLELKFRPFCRNVKLSIAKILKSGTGGNHVLYCLPNPVKMLRWQEIGYGLLRLVASSFDLAGFHLSCFRSSKGMLISRGQMLRKIY
jgi:hypothetical protein